MVTRAALIAWTLAAASFVSHGERSLPREVVEGMVDAALASPLARTDDGVRTTLSLEVAVSWFETGGQFVLNPKGSNDHGHSACWAQVWFADPARDRTIEGWSAEDLRHDALKCATVAVRLFKASVLASPRCESCELTIYARGRDTGEGRALSHHRVALAKRLIRDVPLGGSP